MRWAGCQALGQMCTDLEPELQETEHARIVPALLALTDNFSHPRVQAHAAAAIVNFTEGAEEVFVFVSSLRPCPELFFTLILC